MTLRGGGRPALVVVPPAGSSSHDVLAPVLGLWSTHLRVLDAGSAFPGALIDEQAGGAVHVLGLGSGVGAALAAQQRRPEAVRSLVLADTAEPAPRALRPREGGALVINGRQAPPAHLRHGEALVRLLGGEQVVQNGLGAGVYLAGRRFLDLVLAAIAQAEPIALAEPDPAWRERAAALCDEVLAAVGARAVAIEHVGSTAVPGLVAKPVIDLALGLRDMRTVMVVIPALWELGWVYAEGLGQEADHHFLFCLESGRRAAHLHVVSYEGRRWRAWRTFRDRLRASPADAAAYTRLKVNLALRHPDDREAYTAGKAAFVTEALGEI